MSETEGFAEPDGMSALREALEAAQRSCGCQQAGEVPEDAPLPGEPAMDLLEAAWGIIANAGEGDWDSQRPEWREAAVRWRDRYHVMLQAFCVQDRGHREDRTVNRFGGTTKSLADMTAEVDAYCQAKGWREKPVSFGEAMALLHSEVSEALEAWRNWGLEDATRTVLAGRGDDGSDLAVPNPKPEGVGSEFADVLIRLLDDCAIFGVNLDREMSHFAGHYAISESFGENMNALHVLIAGASQGHSLGNGTRRPGGEFAGVLTFLYQLCGLYGIDLEAEYERKMAYNRTRAYKHGGRTI